MSCITLFQQKINFPAMASLLDRCHPRSGVQGKGQYCSREDYIVAVAKVQYPHAVFVLHCFKLKP